ncbi:hypothetical protein ACFFX0_23920 [Citricoccus parietis]|uniref:Uncharacterized protein n=1 Tax=Citricoccus parietis TaxID=592307 RepID=A0ABV5G552_9MICC
MYGIGVWREALGSTRPGHLRWWPGRIPPSGTGGDAQRPKAWSSRMEAS